MLKEVAPASRQAIQSTLEESAGALRVQSLGGVFSERWDEKSSAKAPGQLTFFANTWRPPVYV